MGTVAVAGMVALAGSRSLCPASQALVGRVAGALARSGRSLVVGCCVGADAAVLGGAPVAAVRVLAAFGPGGAGAGPASAVAAVAAHAAAGGRVSWWSGGPAGVPLSQRLRARTCAVALAGSAGLVAFFDSPLARGTLLAAQLAASRGLSVLAFPCGFAGAVLPALGAGAWVPVGGSGVWAGAWRWVPGQASLLAQ